MTQQRVGTGRPDVPHRGEPTLGTDASRSLHTELATRITRLIHDQAIEPGTRLYEERLAEQLGVSRTPVRAVIERLASQGFIARQQHRGTVLVRRPPLPAVPLDTPAPDDALLVRIATDRRNGKLADQVAENELMAAYALTRVEVKRLLNRLADLGVVERKLGYRWKFVGHPYDATIRKEAFLFRMLIEPAALLQAEFALPPGWLDEMIERHRGFENARWTEASSVAFFEMNASFHEGLAAASGNRFFVDSLHRLNQRRRLANYDWRHGRQRVDDSCREHLGILTSVKQGEMETAAELMRKHLIEARDVRTTYPASP